MLCWCDSEHQELVRQIDETKKRDLREDLERELDCLVRRMEEKAAQISKLRKHKETVSIFAMLVFPALLSVTGSESLKHTDAYQASLCLNVCVCSCRFRSSRNHPAPNKSQVEQPA